MTLGYATPRVGLDRYPLPAQAVSEGALFFAYRTGAGDHPSVAMDPIVEPCACGEAIAVYPGERIPDVYARHVRARRHAAWRHAREEI